MGLFDSLFGTDPKMEQVSRFTPQQEQAFGQFWDNPIDQSPLYQSGSNWLQGILSNSPEAFQQFEAPLMSQFNEQIVPAIAERFGAIAGNRGNSGLNNSLAQAARGLSTNLGGIRAGLQQGAAGQALNYAQQPYNNMLSGFGVQSFDNVQTPGTQGFAAPLLSGIGAAMGGPIGSSLGNALGGGLSSLFKGGGGQGGISGARGMALNGIGGGSGRLMAG